MDWNIGLGVIGLVLSVISLVYAGYVTRKSRREKRLAFEQLWPVPLAQVIAPESGHSLRILYEAPGTAPREVDRAVVHFLRFTNFGKVPIRQQDLAPGDPLRLEISGGAVLDVAVPSITRAVCQVSTRMVDTLDDITRVAVRFNFLDFMDGAIIQVITDSNETALSLKGSIIGMPEGIHRVKDDPQYQAITGWGCILPIALQLSLLGAVPFLYHRWTGSWEHAWYLLLPIVALAIPAILLLLVALVLPLRVEFKFPELLAPPTWYTRHQGPTWALTQRERDSARKHRQLDA